MGRDQSDTTGPAIASSDINRWNLVNPLDGQRCNVGQSSGPEFVLFVDELIDLVQFDPRQRAKTREHLFAGLTTSQIDEGVRFYIANELVRIPGAKKYRRDGKNILQEVVS